VQPREKNVVIDTVEGCTQIQQCKQRDLLVVSGHQDV